MVRPRSRPKTTAKPVAKRIGFIGLAQPTSEEARILRYIGRCIAKLGHTLVTTEAQGAAHEMREGFRAEGGALVSVDKGVIEASDHTHIFPSQSIEERIRQQYPDIDDRDNILLLRRDQLYEWRNAIEEVLKDRGVTRPR
jgi:hypothetical protein